METFWFFRLGFRRAYDSAYDSDIRFSLGHKVYFMTPTPSLVKTSLNPSRKRIFSKTLFKIFQKNALHTGVNWKRWLFIFVWTEVKQFENDENAIITWFLPRVFFKHKFNITADCRVLKFLRRSVGGKFFMGFQSTNIHTYIHTYFIW